MLQRYTDQQLTRITEQSMLYICACPAQICAQLQHLRRLYAYQANCLKDNSNDLAMHEQIAASVERAHSELESCLTNVLQIEGWNEETLTMPTNLQKRMVEEASRQ